MSTGAELRSFCAASLRGPQSESKALTVKPPPSLTLNPFLFAPAAVCEVCAVSGELRDPFVLGDPPAAARVDAALILGHQLLIHHRRRVQRYACTERIQQNSAARFVSIRLPLRNARLSTAQSCRITSISERLPTAADKIMCILTSCCSWTTCAQTA